MWREWDKTLAYQSYAYAKTVRSRVRIVFFPYTKGTSSTILNETLKKLRNDEI
jgi:hypothetical protein